MAKPYVHESSHVEPDVTIGEDTKIWYFCHVRRGARIGANCNIGQNVFVDYDVTIGNRVKIQNNVSVYHGVTIEDEVFVGPSAVFTNVINPRAFIERKEEILKTPVRRGATIGANATIVCGYEIGQYALIGAGAVVTRDVPPYALIVGSPAKRKGWVCRCCTTLKTTGTTGLCPRCGKTYRIDGESCHSEGS